MSEPSTVNLFQPALSHVTIRNFKSIKALDLDLRQFSVFVGPNGSGKTNLIQALTLLGDVLDTGSSDPVRDLGWSDIIRREKKPARSGLTLGVRIRVPAPWLLLGPRPSKSRLASMAPITLVDVVVTFGGRKDTQRVEILREEVILRLEKGNQMLLRVVADGDAPTSVEVIDDSYLAEIFRIPTDKNVADLLRDFFGPRQLEQFTQHRTPETESRRFLRIAGSRSYWLPWGTAVTRATAVERFRLDASSLRTESSTDLRGRTGLEATGRGLAVAVAKLRGFEDVPKPEFMPILETLRSVYGRIQDVRPVQITSGRLSLQFKERCIAEPLDQGSVSDGVLHALALLIALRGEETGVLAIEEPENAIHPWSIRAMIRHAQNTRRQVFLTTHSETVVNAIDDPGSLFIVEQDDNGTRIQEARSKDAAIDAILANSGQRLGDVWMDGTLGGVPGGAH